MGPGELPRRWRPWLRREAPARPRPAGAGPLHAAGGGTAPGHGSGRAGGWERCCPGPPAPQFILERGPAASGPAQKGGEKSKRPDNASPSPTATAAAALGGGCGRRRRFCRAFFVPARRFSLQKPRRGGAAALPPPPAPPPKAGALPGWGWARARGKASPSAHLAAAPPRAPAPRSPPRRSLARGPRAAAACAWRHAGLGPANGRHCGGARPAPPPGATAEAAPERRGGRAARRGEARGR